MPTLSVFIRKDDVDKWKALENKSEFLHNSLNHIADQIKVIKTPYDAKKIIKDEKICKHGYPANGWSCKFGCTK
jgi:hypothetical protein